MNPDYLNSVRVHGPEVDVLAFAADPRVILFGKPHVTEVPGETGKEYVQAAFENFYTTSNLDMCIRELLSVDYPYLTVDWEYENEELDEAGRVWFSDSGRHVTFTPYAAPSMTKGLEAARSAAHEIAAALDRMPPTVYKEHSEQIMFALISDFSCAPNLEKALKAVLEHITKWETQDDQATKPE